MKNIVLMALLVFVTGCYEVTGSTGESRILLMPQRGIHLQVQNYCTRTPLVIYSAVRGDLPILEAPYGRPVSVIIPQRAFRNGDAPITVVAQILSGKTLKGMVSESFSDHLNGGSTSVTWIIGDNAQRLYGNGIYVSEPLDRNGRSLCD